MSDVNLNFAIAPIDTSIVVTTNDITFTPTPINMTLYSGSAPIPPAGIAGNTQVQYNDSGVFGGSNTFVFNNATNTVGINTANVNVLNANNFNSTGTNVSLGDVSHVRITGGTNGYVLQTDGTGNLGWTAQTGGGGGGGTPGGSNTQVQFNNAGSFGAASGFTYNTANSTLSAPNYYGNGSALYNLSGGSVVGSVYEAFHANAADVANSVAGSNVVGAVASATIASSAVIADTVTVSAQPNITSTGTLISLNVSGNSLLGSVNNVKITGGSPGQYLTTSGTGNLSFTSFSNYETAKAQYTITGSSVSIPGTDETWRYTFPAGYNPITTVGVDWSNASSPITTVDLQAITYGNGIYVAVGNAGSITSATSVNGTWANNSVGGTNIYYATTYSNTLNQWIAMGQNGSFATSTSQNTWTNNLISPTTTDTIFGVAWGNGKYVAVTGASGNVYSSTNGTTWSVIASGVLYSEIIFDGTKFYACSGFGISYSTDGITWTATSGGIGRKIAYNSSNGMYVTCASAGAVYYSTDGINFSAGNITWNSPVPILNAIAATSDGYVCGGNNGRRAYSSDGINWTIIAYSGPSNTYIDMASGNGYFIGSRTGGVISYSASNLTRYVLNLPAHTGYPAQTINWTAVVNGTIDQQATSIATAILTLRPTYSVSYPSTGVALVNTNSDGNITDFSLTVSGYAPTSPLVLSITQGSVTLDKFTLTDPANGQTMDYYPSVGQTTGSIGNEISYRETLSTWNMNVAAASTLGTKVTIQTNTPMNVPTGSFPTLTVTNGTGSNLAVSRTILFNGL